MVQWVKNPTAAARVAAVVRVSSLMQWVKKFSIASAVVKVAAEAWIGNVHMLWVQPKNKKKRKKVILRETYKNLRPLLAIL